MTDPLSRPLPEDDEPDPFHVPIREASIRVSDQLEQATRRWLTEAGVTTPETFTALTGVSAETAEFLLGPDPWEPDTVLMVLDTLLSTAVLPD